MLTAFHQIGCVEQSGASSNGEVIIPARDGGRYLLTCPGASEDQIAQATQAYYQQFNPAAGELPSATAAPGYDYVTVYYTCEVETTWEYWPEWGDWVVISQSVNWCRTWRVYHNTGGGSGTWSGGSGGGGGPSNPTVEPPNPPDPQPGDSVQAEDLNAMELRRCVAHPLQCIDYYKVSTEALEWSRSLTSGPIVDNQYDAMRHAYWSLRLTEELGATDAEIWTDLHEWNSRDYQATCMDQFNNSMGRAFAAQIAGLGYTKAQKQAYVQANANQLQQVKGC